MNKNYYLGLDIGTNSCGWAVTDEEYNLLKANGKKLWGVRLYKEAETAVDRRTKRTNRRRLARRTQRLLWLQEIFAPEINKIDKTMLDRIKFSSLWEEDKAKCNISLKSKDSLFNTTINNKQYTDKEYYAEYPTIYHLREELTREPAKDIRLLYLAIHNIIKRRGHYLYEGAFADNQSIEQTINALFESTKDLDADNQLLINFSVISNEKENKLMECLNQNIGIKATKKYFCEILNANSKKEKAFINCIVDGKINLKDIFNNESLQEAKLNFNDEDYDVKINEIQALLTEEQLIVIEKLNEAFSTIQLKKILGNNNYICQAMVDIYNKHSTQLKDFKNFIKTYYSSKYYKIFRSPQDYENKDKELVTNYPLYVNGDIFNGKKRVLGLNQKNRTKEEFYKFIKKILELPPECEQYNQEKYNFAKQKIIDLIENNEFLPKQRTKANAVFPNKLYVKELQQILNVNKEKYEFLNQKDSSGLTNADKILQILTFRIPYFVGPIGENENAENVFGWVKSSKEIELKPWTLNKIVDLDKAENNFIERMTSTCTYLKDKQVLPKNSILYSKYMVLNELNNLKLNGDKISVELKQHIFKELFENLSKVSVKTLKNFLVSNNYCTPEQVKELSIGGIDKDFISNYSSYSKLAMLESFGKNFIDNNLDAVEKVIKYITIITDKNRLEQRLKREFSNIFTDAQIKDLKGFNYQGWGKFSKEFLQELEFVNKETGELTCIINEMWNTNKNLQEILFDSNYTLQEELLKHVINNEKDITYQDVQQLYCSPSVKRAVWQTLKIVKEIIETLGAKPSKIFVEVTRSDQKKGDGGRKLSRQTNLQKMYQSKEFISAVNKTTIDLTTLMQELNHKDSTALRSEKLYLYFLQLGKCAYSGEAIDINDLFNEHKYDVDHIIPQSKIKDDSIENKVLVKSQYNYAKADIYPIYSSFPEWVTKQQPFWAMLKKLNLITKEKYDRLIRKEELTEQELGGFIARQLVETNQSAKAVIDLLKGVVDKPTNIVYSKSKFVTDFRKEHDIPKSRLVNDLHHAKDAFLNIIVGNILNNRFTNDPRNFYKVENKNNNKTINIKKLFNEEIYSINSKKVIWNGASDIARIKKVCENNDCLVTKMSFCDYNGAFYDETIYKSKKNDSKQSNLTELKGNKNNPLSNTEKYGGYNSLKNAYFVLAEGIKKGNKIKTIEPVPVIVYRKYKDSADLNKKILEYIETETGLTNARIIIPKINIQSTFKINDGLYWLGGKTGDNYVLHNANQWFVGYKTTYYIKAIEKYIELKTNKKDVDLIEENGKVVLSKAAKSGNKEISLTKEQNEELYNLIINQLNKPIYSGLSLSTTLLPKLQEYKQNFKELPILQQAIALNGIMQGLATGATSADLSILNGSKNIGKITINKNITNKTIYLLEQSSTGLKTKQRRL